MKLQSPTSPTAIPRSPFHRWRHVVNQRTMLTRVYRDLNLTEMSNLILVTMYANMRYTRSLDSVCLLRLDGKE